MLGEVFLDIFFGDAGAFFFTAGLEGGEFFFVAAGADKGLLLAFYIELHAFVAFGATGIGGTGNGFTVAALTVLADQESAVFAVYGEHAFAADRTIWCWSGYHGGRCRLLS